MPLKVTDFCEKMTGMATPGSTNRWRDAPMQPWPSLLPYARELAVPGGKGELFLYDTGAADSVPIVLIHGLGDEADSWRHLIPLLAPRRVLAPDYRLRQVLRSRPHLAQAHVAAIVSLLRDGSCGPGR
jgi:pimeloyl-ACP methyl ester carboxylesterase